MNEWMNKSLECTIKDNIKPKDEIKKAFIFSNRKNLGIYVKKGKIRRLFSFLGINQVNVWTFVPTWFEFFSKFRGFGRQNW